VNNFCFIKKETENQLTEKKKRKKREKSVGKTRRLCCTYSLVPTKLIQSNKEKVVKRKGRRCASSSETSFHYLMMTARFMFMTIIIFILPISLILILPLSLSHTHNTLKWIFYHCKIPMTLLPDSFFSFHFMYLVF